MGLGRKIRMVVGFHSDKSGINSGRYGRRNHQCLSKGSAKPISFSEDKGNTRPTESNQD